MNNYVTLELQIEAWSLQSLRSLLIIRMKGILGKLVFCVLFYFYFVLPFFFTTTAS